MNPTLWYLIHHRKCFIEKVYSVCIYLLPLFSSVDAEENETVDLDADQLPAVSITPKRTLGKKGTFIWIKDS